MHLESKNIRAFVERLVESTKGDQHKPDIFTIGDDYSFIEEKGSLPENKDTLRFEIEKVLSYGTEHTFEGAKFTPQVILLAPEDIYGKHKQTLLAYQRKLPAISYPFPVEDPIILKRNQGTIHDKKLIPTLTGRDKIRQARTFITTIAFLRDDPPVPYTAWRIWEILWMRSGASQNDFKMKYSTLLEQCRLFYPPWLSNESAQISQGRLNDALQLLSYIGWVEFAHNLSPDTEITVHYSKGDRIRTGIFEFFSKKFVEMTIEKSTKPEKRGRQPSPRSLRIRPSKQEGSLDSYIRS